jgi:hypothetical protein
LPPNKDQWTPSVSATGADRDAKLDELLREIGNDLLEQEVPERLLRVVRAAAAAADEAQGATETEGAPNPPEAKPRSRRQKQ